MAKLICVKMEGCDFNKNAVAWYGYWEGTPTENEWKNAFKAFNYEWHDQVMELAQDTLSEYAGLKRYFMTGAE